VAIDLAALRHQIRSMNGDSSTAKVSRRWLVQVEHELTNARLREAKQA
jgi:hypothetical protein